MTDEASDAEPFGPNAASPDPDPQDPPTADAEFDEDPVDDKLPFGFILTLSLAGLYLAWRVIQGLVLLFNWIF